MSDAIEASAKGVRDSRTSQFYPHARVRGQSGWPPPLTLSLARSPWAHSQLPFMDRSNEYWQGIAGLIVGHPFDTSKHQNFSPWSSFHWKNAVKVRFQSPTIAGKYSSTFHAFASIIHEERFAGLFKGITSPLVRRFKFQPLSGVHWQSSQCIDYSSSLERPHIFLVSLLPQSSTRRG